MFGTLTSNPGDTGSIPGQGTQIPHASWPKHKAREILQQIDNDFKNGPQEKEIFKT